MVAPQGPTVPAIGASFCRVRKGTGSQVSGSWNKEGRADSSF